VSRQFFLLLTGLTSPVIEHAARDYQALNLGGAFVDFGDLRVTEKTFDFELLGARLAAILERRRAMGEQARRVDLDRHVGELPLNRLVLRNRLAEGQALLRVLQRRLERGACDSERLRRDPDAAAV